MRSAILLQPCTTHLFPGFLSLHSPIILVKEKTRNMRFSRSCLRYEGFRYEYDVTRAMPPTARKEHGRSMADAKLREIP